MFDDGVDQLPGFYDMTNIGDFQVRINSLSQIEGIDLEVQLALTSALDILIGLSDNIELDLSLNIAPVNQEPLIVKCVYQ